MSFATCTHSGDEGILVNVVYDIIYRESNYSLVNILVIVIFVAVVAVVNVRSSGIGSSLIWKSLKQGCPPACY